MRTRLAIIGSTDAAQPRSRPHIGTLADSTANRFTTFRPCQQAIPLEVLELFDGVRGEDIASKGFLHPPDA